MTPEWECRPFLFPPCSPRLPWRRPNRWSHCAAPWSPWRERGEGITAEVRARGDAAPSEVTTDTRKMVSIQRNGEGREIRMFFRDAASSDRPCSAANVALEDELFRMDE